MIARAAAAAALLASAACGTSEPDPCDGKTTCLRLDVAGFSIEAIEQLELDIVLGGTVHSTVTTGAPGQAISLPTSTSLSLVVPYPATNVDIVAAGRRAGQVVGIASASQTVFSGDHQSVELALSDLFFCDEDSLQCGSSVGLFRQASTIYRCTDRVPIFYGRCLRSCSSGTFGSDASCFDTGCAEGGRYCGGDKLDGDPHTLYVCNQSRGATPTKCPHSCVVTANGNDTCN